MPRGRAGAALVLCGCLALPPPSVRAAAPPPTPPGRAWILVDARDRSVLAAHDPTAAMPMASTTKLMTAYLSLRELPLGRTLVAPPYHPLTGESLMGLRAGESVSVRSLLYGLLLPSGNDAAVALADGVAGSVPAFVALMNRTAARLGLRDTHYANPIGLDDPANYSTARDLTDLALVLLDDPIFRRIVDTPRAEVPGAHPERVLNHNDLVRSRPWIEGVKTGYTPGAGYVLVGAGKREGVTLVSALLGATSIDARDEGTLELMRYGFSLYHRETVVREGQRLGREPVRGGADPSVSLAAERQVSLAVRRDQRVGTQVDARRTVRAPVRRGDRLGSATVTVDGRAAAQVLLVAAATVRPPSSAGGGIPGWPWSGLGAAVAIVILIGSLVRRHGGRGIQGKSHS